MSVEPIELERFLHHLDRAGATPAPWPAAAVVEPDADVLPFRPDPDVFPVRRDPHQPEPLTDDELLAACRQVRADLAVAVARSRQARGADIDDQGRAA